MTAVWKFIHILRNSLDSFALNFRKARIFITFGIVINIPGLTLYDPI
jgi:hypothetical protein